MEFVLSRYDLIPERVAVLTSVTRLKTQKFDNKLGHFTYQHVKAGLFFGFESSNNEVLKIMKKNATVDQNIKTLEIIKKVGGIGAGLNFIWDNIGDTEETLRKNVELIKKRVMAHKVSIGPDIMISK